MHPDIFGNVLQHHRLNVLNAFVEKLFLPMDNRFDHAVNRLATMLDVAQEIDCRAHFLFDKVPRFFRDGGLRKHLLIAGINAQTRAAVIGKVDDILSVIFQLLDINLRRNQDWLLGRVTSAWERIKRANELQLGR